MISYSFSPNWYRPQCLSFTQQKNLFYYCSNCIVYKYDLQRKIIQSQLNIKDWLIKNQGYNLGKMNNAQKQQGDRQSQSVKGSNRENSEKVLKINCMELVEGQVEDILIVGLNWIGLVLVVSSSNIDHQLKVLSTIDLHKQTGSQVQAIQYLNVDHQKHKDKNNSFGIVVFSSQGIKVNIKLTIAELDRKVNIVVDSWSKIIENRGKRGRCLQVKNVAKDQNKEKQINIVFLSHTIEAQIDSITKSGNIILYDQNFKQILSLTSVNNNQTILSVDFLKGKDENKYIVLGKTNHTNKPNPFCQTFYLHAFHSLSLLSALNSNSTTNILSTKLQIIYPKKCHHKLSQQQKSNLCIKLINQNYAVMTGRLGEMIILNLKQIQQQLQTNPSFTITVRPYSYEEEANNIYRIQHSQRHYKDIYGIYRVGGKDKNITQMYFIGTDHILTQWQLSTNLEIQIQDEKLLRYSSSLKFLTSSVDQIILSQLQPSLVFLRLKDSNIRSFQPYSHRSYWLNEFWKHTNVSFCKKVQKLIMHPKDIGVACLVNDEGKLVFYDLYEERLIRLIQISKKTIKNVPKGNENGNKHKNQHNKRHQQQREKCIQINSISFQHISIIECLQSLYTLHNDTNKQTSDSLKKQFQLKSQQFYDKDLDKDTVIMIQSNEFISILMEGVKQGKYMRIEVYKKGFKLQRIYKTRYWDGNVMLGTRKRKGELMVNVGMRCGEQNNMIIKSIQNEVDLPLGASSRYIFKLCEAEVNSKRRQYYLIVINYKGNKLCIALYSIKTLGKEQTIQLTKLLVSQQTTIPNLTQSTNQTPINIQQLIISQQPNQFLIGVYSNAAQIITIIDYSQIVKRVIDEIQNITCEKQQNNPVGQQKPIEEQNVQPFSYKRSLNQCLAQINNKHKEKLKLEIHQFSGLSYKIENMMFNCVFSEKEMSEISHFIILGKDQSVRLLNLNHHIHLESPIETAQEKQKSPYKVHRRSMLMGVKVKENSIKE